MFLKSFALLLTLGSALALMPVRPQMSADRSLLEFMIESSAAGTTNPALQQYCFNRYLPILKQITDQYEKDYKICSDDYETASAKIDADYAQPYDDITKTVQEACDALKKCDDPKNYVQSFECFSNIGAEQSRELFTMSGFASEKHTSIRDSYRVVESTAEACISKAERTYWENTASTHDELSNCLDGNIVDPTTTLAPEPEA